MRGKSLTPESSVAMLDESRFREDWSEATQPGSAEDMLPLMRPALQFPIYPEISTANVVVMQTPTASGACLLSAATRTGRSG